MRRRFANSGLPRRSWQALALFALAAVFGLGRQWFPADSSPATPAGNEPQSARIERVVDGDTFILAGSKQRVRLIGANTPETVKPNTPVQPWGPEASAFTKRFLADGPLRLESDGDLTDKYGRRLALVWVGDRMLNEELIRAGLARAELRYHYSAATKERFRRAEAEAKSACRGIWSSE